MTRSRVRLDQLLVDRGVFSDVKTAAAWIMGGSVIVNEVREDKPGTAVPRDASIRVRGMDIPYVSRGGLKLAAALERFGVDVTDRIAIDAGASTGGFTHCLLEHGAARVYSVDVGYGQLAGSLRQNPKVVNMERTNIGDVTCAMLDPRPDIGVADLSYLSLSLAVPIIGALLLPAGPGALRRSSEIVTLVKPLFEVAASGPNLTEDQYRAALGRAASAGCSVGFEVDGIMASPIRGSGGTLEFLVHYVPAAQPREDLDSLIDCAVIDGLRILRSAD